jgi:hypothetical protein
MTKTNPWLTSPDPTAPPVSPAPARRHVSTGATAPQPGVPAPDTADRLPRMESVCPAPIWWVGVHGGAGESTLAALTPGTKASGHAWPVSATGGLVHRVVLVARSNFAGLTAARKAATEWASHTLGDSIQLAGLVLIADAPGRRPKLLRDMEQVIAGGVPQVWDLPWVDAWRLGPPIVGEMLPKEFRQLFTDLSLTPPVPSVAR